MLSQSENLQIVDSLLVSYKKASSEIEKVDLLNQLSYESRKVGLLEKSLLYTNQAKLITDNLTYPKGEIAVLLNFASTYRELKMYPEAIAHTQQLIILCETENEPIRKGDAYDNLAHIYYEQGNLALALKNHFTALKIREEVGDNYGIGNSADNIAHIYSSQNRYQDAMKYFMRSQNVFRKVGDISRETLSTANVGLQLYLQGKYPASLLCYYKALENYTSMNNEQGVSWMYRSIGEVLDDSGNLDKAKEYYNRSLEIEQKLNNQVDISELYSLLGRAFIASEEYEKALEYGNKALKISETIESVGGIVKANYFIAEAHLRTANLAQALIIAEKTMRLATLYNLSYFEAILSKQLGEINLQLEQPKEAKKWLLKAIEMQKKMETGVNLFAEYKLLSNAEAAVGDFESAFNYQKNSEDFYNSRETQKAAQLAFLYEAEKKEAQLKSEQQQKDLLTSQELKKKQVERNAAIIGLGLMVLLTIAVIYLFRLRSKKIEIERQNLELKRSEAEAIKETERFKSKFIANISHEFRTLLTLIKGDIEVLNHDLESSNIKPLAAMNQNGDRLLELVNQLLDLSKMENGKYVLIYEEGNLLEKLQGYIYSFESFAAKKNLSFQVNITENARQNLEAQILSFSADALQIIVSNLLSNAIKFTPNNGEVRTTIDFTDETLKLSVSDSGAGILETDIPKIFDRFYQIDSPSSRLQKGSGIGLSLVKELAMLHQGDAIVSNNPEKGACFTVFLKCNPVEILEDTTPPLILNEEKPLILVVEDQAELRKFICNSIGDEFELIEASNGTEGIRLAEKYMPNLIISDVMMPKTDGFELCQHLKNTDATSHIPIILLTGMTDQSDKIKGIEMGADAYLEKPFSVEELRLRIRNVFKLLQNIQSKFNLGGIPKENEIKGLPKRDFELVKKVKTAIDENISDPKFSVGNLAEIACLSQSQLTRKLKAITGQTPSDLIKVSRLNKALQFLREGNNVAESAWAVGFEDPQYFSKVFKRHFGVAPSEHTTI